MALRLIAMDSKGVIIQGSARSFGNTRKITDCVADLSKFDVIDLSDKDIRAFDYEFRNNDDDFIPLMAEVVEKYETLVFATPIYWYSMSGLMKNFVDRFTDLLQTERDIGRRLRGKKMAMISCSGDENVPGYFPGPFVDTAEYLGMKYLGDVHTWIEDDTVPPLVEERLDLFVRGLV